MEISIVLNMVLNGLEVDFVMLCETMVVARVVQMRKCVIARSHKYVHARSIILANRLSKYVSST